MAANALLVLLILRTLALYHRNKKVLVGLVSLSAVLVTVRLPSNFMRTVDY